MTRDEAANILWWASKRHYPGDQMDITAEDIEAFDMAIAALREQGWVRTSVRVPTVLDIDDEGKVPVLIRGMLTRSLIRISLFYKSVTTDTAEYFLPLPKLPEEDA